MYTAWLDVKERCRRLAWSVGAGLTAVICYFATIACVSMCGIVAARFGPGPDFGIVIELLMAGYLLVCAGFCLACSAVGSVGCLLFTIFGSTRGYR